MFGHKKGGDNMMGDLIKETLKEFLKDAEIQINEKFDEKKITGVRIFVTRESNEVNIYIDRSEAPNQKITFKKSEVIKLLDLI